MTLTMTPMLANAAVFAIKNSTVEGKITVISLLVLSLFSWTIIISKFRQLLIARKATKRFFEAYISTRDPLDIQRKGEEYDGALASAHLAHGLPTTKLARDSPRTVNGFNYAASGG